MDSINNPEKPVSSHLLSLVEASRYILGSGISFIKLLGRRVPTIEADGEHWIEVEQLDRVLTPEERVRQHELLIELADCKYRLIPVAVIDSLVRNARNPTSGESEDVILVHLEDLRALLSATWKSEDQIEAAETFHARQQLDWHLEALAKGEDAVPDWRLWMASAILRRLGVLNQMDFDNQ